MSGAQEYYYVRSKNVIGHSSEWVFFFISEFEPDFDWPRASFQLVSESGRCPLSISFSSQHRIRVYK